ncbi:MAG: hypothetical protein PHC61_12865 [Chitinivibrionales bacterium]|nr:hypothetical protein [Chitinivibrionales bacterium]
MNGIQTRLKQLSIAADSLLIVIMPKNKMPIACLMFPKRRTSNNNIFCLTTFFFGGTIFKRFNIEGF